MIDLDELDKVFEAVQNVDNAIKMSAYLLISLAFTASNPLKEESLKNHIFRNFLRKT